MVPFANSHQYIQSYSHLDREQWTFLNHGAFGLALDVGLRRSHSWRMFLESQPLRYFDRYLLNHLAHGARCMVDFVTRDEADANRIREGTALIQNVTSGMNAVIGGHARCDANRDRFVFYYVSFILLSFLVSASYILMYCINHHSDHDCIVCFNHIRILPTEATKKIAKHYIMREIIQL